jgi:hypothetical protein
MDCDVMEPILPSWFKYRQGKAEKIDDHAYRLSAPNLGPAVIAIRQGDNGRWAAVLRPDGEAAELAATEAEFERPGEAWEAAFELMRQHVVY